MRLLRVSNPDLDRIEHDFMRPGRPLQGAWQIRRHLDYLHHRLTRAGGDVDGRTHSVLRDLMIRSRRVRTGQEARALLRDVREFEDRLGLLSNQIDIESRLRELETQVKTASEAAPPELLPEGEVVTLEGLTDKKFLFAIMPFAPDFEDVWKGGIKRAAAGTGLVPIRIDMLTHTSEITDDIVQAIQLSELVVVDVTRNNPNVMFEFGFALASKKPHVVISQSTEFLTFDIKNLRTVVYRNTWQGIETLHKDLQPFIRGTIAKHGSGHSKKPKGKTKPQTQP
jgi:hypothetical protein